MSRKESLRLSGADGRVVVTVDDAIEHELGVLRVLHGRLHGGDPGVLVRCRLSGRKDGDFAGAARCQVARHIGEALADAVGVGLVHEDVVRADGRAGVISDDLDAGSHRRLQGRGDCGRVIGGDDDRRRLLSGGRLDERDLLRRVSGARADLGDGPAEGRLGCLCALEGDVEVRVINLLGDHHHAAERGSRRRSSRCGGAAAPGHDEDERYCSRRSRNSVEHRFPP